MGVILWGGMMSWLSQPAEAVSYEIMAATKGSVIVEGVDESCGEQGFLGFRPWYKGLTKSGCEIGTPNNLPAFVWTIVLNILADLLIAVGYLALGFTIYGGFKYIISTGDPGKVAASKKILTSAAIGMVIALLASMVVDTIIKVLGG